MDRSRTISLIGMPGTGKSTVGIVLAKLSGLGFVDTDIEIQTREQATLQDIVEGQGYERLRAIEAAVIGQTELQGNVVATGGSAVYSQVSMARLGTLGPVVYLEADLLTLEQRVAAQPDRGIANPPEQSLAEVYAERVPLYERFADMPVSSTQGAPEEIARVILEHVLKRF